MIGYYFTDVRVPEQEQRFALMQNITFCDTREICKSDRNDKV